MKSKRDIVRCINLSILLTAVSLHIMKEKELGEVVQSAQGKVICSFEEEAESFFQSNTRSCIVSPPPETEGEEKRNNKTRQLAESKIERFMALGVQPIKEDEISSAIIHCDVQSYCNPPIITTEPKEKKGGTLNKEHIKTTLPEKTMDKIPVKINKHLEPSKAKAKQKTAAKIDSSKQDQCHVIIDEEETESHQTESNQNKQKRETEKGKQEAKKMKVEAADVIEVKNEEQEKKEEKREQEVLLSTKGTKLEVPRKRKAKSLPEPSIKSEIPLFPS